MPTISAVDAIGPAIQRTKTFLFKPFRLSTYLKLCLVAVLTEGCGANFNFSGPSGHWSSHNKHFLGAPSSLSPEIVIALIAAALAFIALGFVVFYLITRLRFAYFHCLINNTREIRPGWRRYRAQANHFFWLNLVVGICFLFFAVIVALPFVAGFWELFHHTPAGSHPDIGTFLLFVLLLLPVVFLFILAALVADLVLRDFMLPHYALDNATASQAWAAVWNYIKAEKAPFLVYALLRVILPIATMIGLFLVLIIPMLIFVAIFIAIEVGIHSAFAGTVGGAMVLGILFESLVGFVGLGIALLIGLSAGGPVSTAIREYALVFYGGRYERLGEFLFPIPDAPQPSPGMS